MNEAVAIAPKDVDGSEDGQARRLVTAAGAQLTGGAPKNFAELLFGRAAPEDLIHYEADERARLAQRSWGFRAERKPGAFKLRMEQPAGDGRLGSVAVIEIINDDKPFLLDSTMGELADHGLVVQLVAHPVLTVGRDPDGRLTGLSPDGKRESLIHIHVERVDDEARRARILSGLGEALTEVQLAVADWRPMLARVNEAIADLKTRPPPLPADEVAEAIEFLQWLLDDNFTFLGVRSDTYDETTGVLAQQPDTVLGILRHRDNEVMTEGGERLGMPAAARAFLKEPQAPGHRRVTMDLVGIKRYDAAGRLVGIFRIVGLFTSTAYTRSTLGIPYLRRKTRSVIARSGLDPDSHSGKALAVVLEQYPRDELFQVGEDTLLRFGLMILQLEERPRVRVLARRDRFHRFVSVLVYVPRDRFDSAIRQQIGDMLTDASGGGVAAFTLFFPEGPLVRVHFIVARGAGEMASPTRTELESAVSDIVRTWADGLADAIGVAHEPARAQALLARYRDAFSDAYREAYSPLVAVQDIRMIESLSAARPLGVDFYQRLWEEKQSVGLKIWSRERPIPLSERVPVLEHMGFRVVDETTYQAQAFGRDAPDFWLHDMALTQTDGAKAGLGILKPRLEACFMMAMRGLAESDGFNALVLAAGLPWRDIAMLRSFARYLRQIRVPYSQDYLWATLVKHAAIAARLAELFHLRFDPRLEPAGGDDAREAAAPNARAVREAALAAEVHGRLQKGG